MIARLLLLLVLALSAACTSPQPPHMLADPARYEVQDTAEYESVLSSGEYGLLLRDGRVIDSVDVFMGVHRLNNGAVVFLPVKPSPVEDVAGALSATEYVIFDGRRRILLNSFLPNFSDYFSSPSVIDGILYYWGLQELPGGEYRINAHRYDPRRRSVRSLFLIQDDLATDNRGHFAPPHLTDDGIRFASYPFTFIVSADLASKQPVTSTP